MKPVARALFLTGLLSIAIFHPTAASAGPLSPPAPPAVSIEVGDAQVSVEFAPGAIRLPQDAIVAWIRRSACAVAGYYGRFPVSRFRIRIVPAEGRRGVLSGTTWGFGGAHARILLGETTRQSDLDADWIMTHEMVHLAFPRVGDEHRWIDEGIATYVEPIARAGVRNYPVAQVWQDLVASLPKGMPQADDNGLDHTHTWGRTYWGGAMFCLMADVEIRRRTGNRHGLEDALRGVVAAGGNDEVEWTLERAFKAGDNAVGVPVLTELYARMKAAPVAPDLAATWKSLGVVPRGQTVIFDDAAPDAAFRRAITNLPRLPIAGCAQFQRARAN